MKLYANRFWSYVEKGPDDSCWPWGGGLFTNGYGQFRVGSRKVKAHRFAYETAVGPIAAGLVVCHRCDNKVCCNPAHLFAGTPADNAHDRDRKGRTRNGRVSLPGERNPSARLTREQVEAIRLLARSGMFQRQIAAQFSVSQSQIGNIVRGTAWA